MKKRKKPVKKFELFSNHEAWLYYETFGDVEILNLAVQQLADSIKYANVEVVPSGHYDTDRCGVVTVASTDLADTKRFINKFVKLIEKLDGKIL